MARDKGKFGVGFLSSITAVFTLLSRQRVYDTCYVFNSFCFTLYDLSRKRVLVDANSSDRVVKRCHVSEKGYNVSD